MRTDEQPDAAVVTAARAGDQRALDELVAGYLPLVYNIVGRALEGHADVDDVVQETMLRAVDGLEDLRDPERFRPWLVAIAVRQVRERWRSRQARPQFPLLEEALDTADPGGDFADLTILRLALSGQRREVVEATRWLEDEDRELLSLWWLEQAGRLTRAELASACELPPQHAAVRVQRMKARLETARAVVRALCASPRCEELSLLVAAWDARPSALWRKRLARHVRDCPMCLLSTSELVPAEGLLAGLALVPLPVGLAGCAGLKLAAAGAAAGGATAAAGAAAGAVHAAGGAGRLAKLAAQLVAQLAAKPVAVAATAGVLTVAGGTAALYVQSGPAEPHRHRPGVVAASPALPGGRADTSGAQGPATVRPAPLSSPETGGGYGSVVDAVDAAPPVGRRPGPLPVRPEGRPVTVTAGRYVSSTNGHYHMVHHGEFVTLTGQGYFTVRYQVTADRVGQLQMPTWTGLQGRLFHVASGGGHRMDDQVPGAPDHPHTWMGSAATGFNTLPPGAQQMWQNEFFYLDGTVTLHLNQTWADYSFTVFATTRAAIVADVNTPPVNGVVRYGLVRDTGGDDTPVPQYLTRDTPADPVTVPQQSKVG